MADRPEQVAPDLKDRHISVQVAMARDWAGIALRRATQWAGTPEGADWMAHHKRYTQLADAIAHTASQLAAEVAKARAEERERMADMIERMTRLRRAAKAALNDMPIQPCEFAAAIRQAGEAGTEGEKR